MGLIEHPTNSTSEKVIGAAIEVHRHLGPGLLESTYQACLCRELELRGIAYHSQVVLPLEYKGVKLKKGYVIDLLIAGSVIVEIKTVETPAAPLLSAYDLHAPTRGSLWSSDELQRRSASSWHKETTALTSTPCGLRVFRASVVELF